MKKLKPSQTLASLLKESRIKSSLSQKEVADALGYSTAQVVSDWERGVRTPPGPSYRKLIKLYHASTEEFFNAILEERTLILEKKIKKLVGFRD